MYEYLNIWKDWEITIDIFEAEWMLIFIKSDVSMKAACVYFFDQRDREVINETFDKMHDQSKIK